MGFKGKRLKEKVDSLRHCDEKSDREEGFEEAISFSEADFRYSRNR